MPKTIPADELQRLSAAVVRAHELAQSGRILTGYLHIYQGLAQADGRTDEWAPAAMKLWRQALDEYKTAHPSNWGELD
jgi:hypothetical protein